MRAEVGDKFIINWEEINKIYKKVLSCKDPDKEFKIKRFSKSGISVYFDDNRTNKRGCKCQICDKNISENSIGLSQIIITRKRIAVEREIKLAQLGIK
jgi:hypothetical protein